MENLQSLGSVHSAENLENPETFESLQNLGTSVQCLEILERIETRVSAESRCYRQSRISTKPTKHVESREFINLKESRELKISTEYSVYKLHTA